MPSGYPDWRPPGSGGGSRLFVFVTVGVGPTDLIAAPGAGFRIVLYDLMVEGGTSGTQAQAQEFTPANVFVRDIFNVTTNGTNLYGFSYGGVPLAAGNKLRCPAVGGGSKFYHITYVVEAI
jgi:hypothetical protein